MSTLFVKYLNDIKISNLTSSHVTEFIQQEHRTFFDGASKILFNDSRHALTPRVGPTITEVGIDARWIRYDSSYRAEARLKKFWCVELSDAVIYPPYGIVRIGDTFIKDTIRKLADLQDVLKNVSNDNLDKAFRDPCYGIECDLLPVSKIIDERAFVLGSGVFGNYFNWTLRYISKINTFQKSGVRLLISPPTKIPYILDSLRFFGINIDNLIQLREPIRVKTMVLASPVALGRYQLSPQICQNLRGHSSVRSLSLQGKSRKIYVPRRDVKMRSVKDADLVDNFFTEQGFLVFDNSVNKIADQIAAFSAAEIVVAVHGAGLANIVYCRPGTLIVEIVPEGYDQGVTSYRSLSDLFSLNYIQVFAKEELVDRKGNRCNSDISIDLVDIKTLLLELETTRPVFS